MSMHRPTRRLALVLALTATFAGIEVVGGLLSGALALLADAGHMVTDMAGIGIALAASWVAERPAGHQKTYGHLRWEILAALANGVLLVVLSGWIVVEAIGRLGAPREIDGLLFGGVALAGLGVNAIALRVLHGTSHDNLNARAAYLHVLSDLLGSVGALLAAVIVATTGWTTADTLVSLAIAALIMRGAWRLLRESTRVLLEEAPAHIPVPELERRLRAVAGVTEVHDLHLWTVSSGVVAMSGHAVVPDLRQHPLALERIRAAAAELGVDHVTVQLETERGCAGCER